MLCRPVNLGSTSGSLVDLGSQDDSSCCPCSACPHCHPPKGPKINFVPPDTAALKVSGPLHTHEPKLIALCAISFSSIKAVERQGSYTEEPGDDNFACSAIHETELVYSEVWGVQLEGNIVGPHSCYICVLLSTQDWLLKELAMSVIIKKWTPGLKELVESPEGQQRKLWRQ